MTRKRAQVEGIVVVPEASERVLNQRQLEDYRAHRTQLIRWIRTLGRDPEKAEGYAYDTARQRCYKIDQFYRWLWNEEDGYTLAVTVDHADQYSKEQARTGAGVGGTQPTTSRYGRRSACRCTR